MTRLRGNRLLGAGQGASLSGETLDSDTLVGSLQTRGMARGGGFSARRSVGRQYGARSSLAGGATVPSIQVPNLLTGFGV